MAAIFSDFFLNKLIAERPAHKSLPLPAFNLIDLCGILNFNKLVKIPNLIYLYKYNVDDDV